MKIELKNNAPGILEETQIEDGFRILAFQNEIDDNQNVIREIDSSLIQFHFYMQAQTAPLASGKLLS